MEVQPTGRPPLPEHSNEPKAVVHIRVASGIRRIEFIPSSASGLPPLV